ncbi:hypothetical protein BJ508DRAFT_312311 [Ascobolus immersus RN42]|uniref:Uncharacterized protein n=1 Tax=Ascobolus immersus RN42 TaxID=1160509 RepID=A0A3N4HMP3_ASCIM|nr:hypothetical protein BJ508DRAFT_312311 [Ascobolus immersus RN42]
MSYSLPGFNLSDPSLTIDGWKLFRDIGAVGSFDGSNDAVDGAEASAPKVDIDDGEKGGSKQDGKSPERFGWRKETFGFMRADDKEVALAAAQILPHISSSRALRNALTLGTLDNAVRWALAFSEDHDQFIKTAASLYPRLDKTVSCVFPLYTCAYRMTLLGLISEEEEIRRRGGSGKRRAKKNSRRGTSGQAQSTPKATATQTNKPEEPAEDIGEEEAPAVEVAAEEDVEEPNEYDAHVFCHVNDKKLAKKVRAYKQLGHTGVRMLGIVLPNNTFWLFWAGRKNKYMDQIDYLKSDSDGKDFLKNTVETADSHYDNNLPGTYLPMGEVTRCVRSRAFV